MKQPHIGWFLLVASLALAPAGFRMLTWRAPRHADVDSDMARAGQVLFNHEWKAKDPLSNGGDGLGPVFNAKSCKACHNQGGIGGGGDLEHNVTAFIVQHKSDEKAREGVVHLDAVKGQQKELLSDLHPDLPHSSRLDLTRLVNIPGQHCDVVRFPEGIHISQRNTPALFGAKLIDEGVADSAPYMHDGRAKTLQEAIRFHAGQAATSAQRFAQLPVGEQMQLVSFLKSLRAPKQ